MTDIIRRHRGAGWRDGVFRIVAFVLAVALLARGWNLVRPAVAHQLARIQLGNWRAVPLIERAIRDRNPELAPEVVQTSTFRGRRAGAAILVRLDTGNGSWRDEWVIVDEQLAPIGRTSVSLWYSNGPPPDDRDGDGSIEVSERVYVGSRSAWPAHAVAQIGPDRCALLAVIIEPPRGAPSWMTAWTDSDSDERHELEVFTLQTTGATSAWTSELKLGWAAPGRMMVERPSTGGFEVWLPPQCQPVTFTAAEPFDEVIRRVVNK